jgi:hypothetical protein
MAGVDKRTVLPNAQVLPERVVVRIRAWLIVVAVAVQFAEAVTSR